MEFILKKDCFVRKSKNKKALESGSHCTAVAQRLAAIWELCLDIIFVSSGIEKWQRSRKNPQETARASTISLLGTEEVILVELFCTHLPRALVLLQTVPELRRPITSTVCFFVLCPSSHTWKIDKLETKPVLKSLISPMAQSATL